MQIIVIGANGQVGAAVTLLLANTAGIKVRPIVRSRSGSAFLRFHGVPVMHGSISDPAQSKRLQDGGDVIANFALALGTPAFSLRKNEQIIAQTFAGSPSSAAVVFFSTLAVHGISDPARGRQRTMYSKLKLRNEQQVLALARKTGRNAYVLRLGHVAGSYQNINQVWRAEIEAGPIRLVDPDRHANVTFTATIAEALCAIGEGRAGPPGLYDLVNVPQWSWREIYLHEADILGLPLLIEKGIASDGTAAAGTHRTGIANLKALALATINSLGLKELATKMAADLPNSLNESLLAEHRVSRVSAEISQLARPPQIKNSAQLWPAIVTNNLTGLRETRKLLVNGVFAAGPSGAQRWPADL